MRVGGDVGGGQDQEGFVKRGVRWGDLDRLRREGWRGA
jgi:hypothetical protein